MAANFPAHKSARLVRLNGHNTAIEVTLPEALAHAYDRPAGPDPPDDGVREHAGRKLGQDLGAQLLRRRRLAIWPSSQRAPPWAL